MNGPKHVSVSFAVVIPMYNEENGADPCIRAVLNSLDQIHCRSSLIVVNDGSLDGTREVLDKTAPHPKLAILHHERNGGYGAALMTGAREAVRRDLEYALFMDSDLTNPPEDIAHFIPSMELGIDVIKGCRFCGDGQMIGVPWKRRVMTTMGRIVSRILFRIGVKDCTNGFRAIKARIFAGMPLQERGFPIIMEELYWAKRYGCTFANVPTTLYNRSGDLRQSLFAYNYRTLAAYLKYAIRASIVPRKR